MQILWGAEKVERWPGFEEVESYVGEIEEAASVILAAREGTLRPKEDILGEMVSAEIQLEEAPHAILKAAERITVFVSRFEDNIEELGSALDRAQERLRR